MSQTALRTGARLVHACGFDSVPHDLGAWFTVHRLPSDQPITLRGVVRSGGMFSGGTFHSALDQFARARQMRSTYAARRRAGVARAPTRAQARGTRPPGRRSTPPTGSSRAIRPLGATSRTR